jgi:hypothetical protein
MKSLPKDIKKSKRRKLEDTMMSHGKIAGIAVVAIPRSKDKRLEITA